MAKVAKTGGSDAGLRIDLDLASPSFMGLARFGPDIGIFCDFLYSVLLVSAIFGLYFLGLYLSRP